jgi:formamidopyrimidine-DNA glycosylase
LANVSLSAWKENWLVLHLMIAGRLHWHGRVVKTSKVRLATFDFASGTLSLTEAGTQRRASLHLVLGEAGLQRLDPGGLEVFEIDCDRFAKVLQSENHTLKRALTDPRLLSGIGNAYSDEILWAAQLSPIALTQKLTAEEIERLFNSTRDTLTKWIELLRADVTQTVSLRMRRSSPTLREGANQIRTGSGSDQIEGQKVRSRGGSDPAAQLANLQVTETDSQATIAFPEKVTAFRPEMAVHGKYQQPCPRCGARIQRIRYASNETNYCSNCQTAGKLLADRALSRLLRSDWPRTADEHEGLARQ